LDITGKHLFDFFSVRVRQSLPSQMICNFRSKELHLLLLVQVEVRWLRACEPLEWRPAAACIPCSSSNRVPARRMQYCLAENVDIHRIVDLVLLC
jgi:hypothetical protein